MAVFLSHKSDDVAAYEALCMVLKANQIEYWDASTMQAGRPLADQLMKAIRESEACIFVATRESIKAPWVLAELGAFWGAGKLVVTYVAESGVSEQHFPPQFQGSLWTNDPRRVIDAVKSEDLAQRMTELSGGMIYLLRQLEARGWSLDHLAELWKGFKDPSDKRDDAYKAAKYACQCLEALGLASRFGGDEYFITRMGTQLLRSPSLRNEPKYMRAFQQEGV